MLFPQSVPFFFFFGAFREPAAPPCPYQSIYTMEKMENYVGLQTKGCKSLSGVEQSRSDFGGELQPD